MSAAQVQDLELEIFGDDSDISDVEEPSRNEERQATVSKSKPAKVSRRRKVEDEGAYENEKQKKKKRKRRQKEEDSEGETPGAESENPQLQEFDSVVKSLKNKRSRNEYDEMAADEGMIALVNEMKDAAIEDANSNSQKKPAIAKLRLLRKVTDFLNKSFLHEQLIENDILEAMKLWLEPLPDGSLPSLNIRQYFFEVMPKMPITTENLRNSRLGRVVMFYSKFEKETPDIRRKAADLINAWSQPLIQSVARSRPQAARTVDNYEPRESQDGSMRAGDLGYVSQHARIPQANRTTYTIAPQPKVVYTESKEKVMHHLYSSFNF
ncbi:hypothetical protein MP638_006565 [Amoeboaphelidium occidentale]|nr:hypothetical protein MP638_006565 [Amoeboaphelidium occidentale]